jgi:predicted metal-dependent phosphoesterase TrpH
MKGDFHIHSHHSLDSLTDVRTILKVGRRLGFDSISITDHESMRGSLEAKAMAKEFQIDVILGMEINTDKGDILALQIGEEINKTKWEEVIDDVHAQGGITVLPHPFRGHKEARTIGKDVDLIEVHNGRCGTEENRMAQELARELGKPILAGSDAHFWTEIGNSLNELEDLKHGATSWKGSACSPIETYFSRTVKDIRGSRLGLLPYHTMKFLRSV